MKTLSIRGACARDAGMVAQLASTSAAVSFIKVFASVFMGLPACTLAVML
jgi:hypothetical protein